jgi:hypothetical protein
VLDCARRVATNALLSATAVTSFFRVLFIGEARCDSRAGSKLRFSFR